MKHSFEKRAILPLALSAALVSPIASSGDFDFQNYRMTDEALTELGVQDNPNCQEAWKLNNEDALKDFIKDPILREATYWLRESAGRFYLNAVIADTNPETGERGYLEGDEFFGKVHAGNAANKYINEVLLLAKKNNRHSEAEKFLEAQENTRRECEKALEYNPDSYKDGRIR